MSNVVHIKEFTLKKALAAGLPRWRRYFKEDLTVNTKLADLSLDTLLGLAHLQGENAVTLQDIVMAFLGQGPNLKFQFLPASQKLKVLDAFLYFADQVRFECMRRLGWVNNFAGEKFPLVELIVNNEQIRNQFLPKYPALSQTHPRYADYVSHRGIEGEAVVRSLIPAALKVLEDMQAAQD